MGSLTQDRWRTGRGPKGIRRSARQSVQRSCQRRRLQCPADGQASHSRIRSWACWISPIMRAWSSIICLTLAPALAGLVDMVETPVDGAAAGIAAGLSGIRDTGGSLIAFRIGGLEFSIGGRSIDRGRIADPHRRIIRPASSAHRQGFNPCTSAKRTFRSAIDIGPRLSNR